MRGIHTLLAATLLVAAEAEATPLSVVGFNIESGGSSDHVIALQLDKSVGVDIWGLSDVWDDGDWLKRLKRGAESGEGSEFGLLLGDTGGASRLLAVYRQTRLEYLGHEEIESAQASRRDSAPLAVHFRLDRETEFLFLVVNLSQSDKRRADQVEALAEWTAIQTLPILSVGTFNFGLDTDGSGGEGEMARLAAAGWKWVRPVAPVGTHCGGRDVVQDFVFVAGTATEWGARSEVMFPQNNYCPDDDRTSDHRPLLANLDTRGRVPVVTGSMPAREIKPFFPDTLSTGSDAQIELANDPQPVGAVAPQSVTHPVAADAARTGKASTTVSAWPESGVGADLSKAELMRRLERLEAEVRSLRQAIEARPE